MSTMAPSAASDTETSIPLVDFHPFLQGSHLDQKTVATQIDHAFRTVGFVYLFNHGIPQEKVDECFQWVHISLQIVFSFAFVVVVIDTQWLIYAWNVSRAPASSPSQ